MSILPDIPKPKPPIGIVSERIWKMDRCFELVRAIARYDEAKTDIPEEWLIELGKLIPEVFE